jgi:solute carrier family 35 protein E1
MASTALPDAFLGELNSPAHMQYRKGYRSFRRAGVDAPPDSSRSGSQNGARLRRNSPPVPIPDSMTAMRALEGAGTMKCLPASLSEDAFQTRAKAQLSARRRGLGIRCDDDDDDDLEPYLAASPFRLRRSRWPSIVIEDEAPVPDYAEELSHLGSVPSSEDLYKLGHDASAYLRARLVRARAADTPDASSRRMTALFIFVWYMTGAFTNSSSKLALASLPASLPLTLTAVQHLSASACGFVVYRLLRLQPYKPLPAAGEVSAEARRALGWLCVVYTLGFSLTNASFGAVNASFVDTVKAAEPISTVLLAQLFLANERITARVGAALLPIVGGVALSSMAEASASLIGLAFALGSNFCFSARSIAAKLVGKRMGADRMDGANLFVHVNRLGLVALVPAVLALEGRQLAALALSLPAARLLASLRLFLFNGVMYYLNNQMNFLVLEQVDTLTHGIINCGRRVANILFAIMWFGNRVTAFNGAGISLALAGGFLYVRAKMADAKADAKAAKEAAKAAIAEEEEDSLAPKKAN